MLSGANQQIISAYEELGMSPEQIAADESEGGFGYDIVAIKATLMQFSSKYRDNSKVEINLDFTTDEQLAARNAMVDIMRSTEDDYLKARLAMRIRDDAKGRLDINPFSGANINITIFNARLLEAQAAKMRSKGLPKPAPKIEAENAIDINAEMVPA